MKRSILLSVLLLITIGYISACYQTGPKTNHNSLLQIDTTAYDIKCGDYHQFRVNKLVLHNNVWGKQSIKHYKQCIYNAKNSKSFTLGWVWQWPMTTRVVGYPEIFYGHNPWHSYSTSTNLPRKVSGEDITVNYDLKLTAYGTYNLAFDIWLNKTNPPTPESITHEIMIWMANSKMVPLGTVRAYLDIDGIKYTLYVQEGVTLGQPSGNRSYIAFVTDKPYEKAALNLGKFMQYLIDHKYIDKKYYMSSIEFGNEIVGGTGKIKINKFTINFP